MNFIEAMQFCIEGTSVRAKHWKNGRVVYTSVETNPLFPGPRFYLVDDRDTRKVAISFNDPESIFGEWEVVDDSR